MMPNRLHNKEKLDKNDGKFDATANQNAGKGSRE